VHRHFRIAGCILAGMLMLALRTSCQVQAGDLSMNMSGVVSGGYNGQYGNVIGSSHGLDFGGNGTLTGSYYDPNFLNFNFTPYYNQSRANSNFQSIFETSGFNLNSGIFSGSHFPGSVNYAKAYNSQGSFGIPGVTNFTTHGNSDTFGINWSELIPDRPALTVGYQRGSNDYSLFGTDQTGETHFQSFNARSSYRLEGFNLGAYYSKSVSDSTFPELFGSTLQQTTSDADTNTFGFSAGHTLPLHGSISTSFNRSDINSNYLGYKFNGAIDTVNATAGIQPTNKLHLQASASYTDNLSGTLYQAIVPTTTGASSSATSQATSSGATTSSDQSSHSWDMIGSASYSFLPNLQAQIFGERREQSYLGQAYGGNSVGGGLSYGRVLFGGGFNASFFASDNTADNNNTNSLGLNTSAGYNHAIGRWNASGNFSYAQNMQTLLVRYTTSYYSYSASLRRSFGNNLSWSGTAGGSRTGLTILPGTESDSQSYSTGLSYSHWIGTSASYAKSNGQGLLNGGGIVPTPIPPIIPGNLLILYGGHSYSFSLSSSPARRLTIAAAYSHANLNINNGGNASWNKAEQFNAQMQYQFRKMYFTGGYTRLLQGFSAAGTPPNVVSSFSLNVSRWFNFF
jgi:hypothetical protein